MSGDIFVVFEHLRGQIADISYIMLAAARDLAQTTGGEVIGVLLGHNAQDIVSHVAADRVLYGDHPALADFNPEGYANTLSGLIQAEGPRAVFFGSTSIGADIAGVLSARLGLPLVGSCIQIGEGNIISKICGGKIMVETVLADDDTTLITMIPGGYKPAQGQSETPPTATPFEVSIDSLRISLKQYIEPEAGDVDISSEKVLIAIGRGIQTADNIELAQELAELLGGAVCASRPVVDQGWLPATRLVGKSGKSVKPKLYLALGISGAPEHVEGMADAEMVVAINMDPNAPIFNVATYGAEIDLFDLIDPLIEKLEAAA